MWDDDPPWTLPGAEGKKAEEREKNSDSFYGISILGHGPLWTLLRVKCKKAEEKGKKCPTHFTEILVWDDDPPWTLPGVEGKKAEEREKNSDSFYGNFSVGRRPSMDTAWGRR